jgi:hypothetical protein
VCSGVCGACRGKATLAGPGSLELSYLEEGFVLYPAQRANFVSVQSHTHDPQSWWRA